MTGYAQRHGRLGTDLDQTAEDMVWSPGVNFELLHEAVGPDRRGVAFDFRSAMVERPCQRITDHGWTKVEVFTC